MKRKNMYAIRAMQSVLALIGSIGLCLLAYSFTMGYYTVSQENVSLLRTNYNQWVIDAHDDQQKKDQYVDEYYAKINEIETPKRKLQDVGSGLVIFSTYSSLWLIFSTSSAFGPLSP